MQPATFDSPSPFFSSRPILEPTSSTDSARPPPPSQAQAGSAAPSKRAKEEKERAQRPEDLRYWGEEKLVLSVDIGSSFSSVTLTHLRWGSAPLSSTPSAAPSTSGAPIRSVLAYPSSSPSLTPIPSRVPSLIAYDRHDRPRAFGAECLLPETRERARDEGWVTVKSWKEQMRPAPLTASPSPIAASFAAAADGKKVLKKSKPGGALGLALGRSHTSPSLAVPPFASFPPTNSSFASLHTTSSASFENLLDAVDAKTEVHGPSAAAGRTSGDSGRPILLGSSAVDGGSGVLAGLGEVRVKDREKKDKKEKEHKVFHGPKLRDIYGDFLKHLVACTRAWFAETTLSGEPTFLRLWPSCVFVVSVPADWTSAETDLIREGMERANLLPANFEVGRLIFAKESAAVVHFARRHTRDAERTWLKEGQSFALCDAAEHGVSVIGYTVVSLTPKLKLRAYEPLSRLPTGAHSILLSFRTLLSARLQKTKFSKSPSFAAHLVEEFRLKVLPKFTGAETAEFRLRVQPEQGAAAGGAAGGGAGAGEFDPKAERWIDTGARIRDGWMTLSVRDIEECFRPSVDAIIVRLSSTLPRGGAKHILLSGGFGESPYLVRRLRETFEPSGCRIIIPDIPTHLAASEGALRFFLSETLAPRRTRFALGVRSAVDWRTASVPGMHEREMVEGSGGRRLVLGRWSEVVPRASPLDPSRPWRKTFHFRYRLAAQDPVFPVQLWAHDPARPLSGTTIDAASVDGEEAFDGWMERLDGKTKEEFLPVAEVKADLYSLVALSEIYGDEGKEWVQLQVDLVIYVGEETLEAAVVWKENGNEVRGPPTRLDGRFF
ncbi:hypothetical protein JCM6882_001577 [Rhodosporidiobolus microsporus]